MANALFCMRKWGVLFSDDIIFPLKQVSKTCNWVLNLPLKTCAVWIYNILWNLWPIVHYTVRKTYEKMLPVSAITKKTTHNVYWSIKPPSKISPSLFFLQDPLKSANCISPPFLWKTATHLEKGQLLFPSNLPLKTETLSSTPFFKIWLDFQPPIPLLPAEIWFTLWEHQK